MTNISVVGEKENYNSLVILEADIMMQIEMIEKSGNNILERREN